MRENMPIDHARELRRNVKRSRGGLVFKAHRLVYHSTLGWRVIKKEKIDHAQELWLCARAWVWSLGLRVWGLGV